MLLIEIQQERQKLQTDPGGGALLFIFSVCVNFGFHIYPNVWSAQCHTTNFKKKSCPRLDVRPNGTGGLVRMFHNVQLENSTGGKIMRTPLNIQIQGV